MLETGRKNQIRVHMQDLGHPIIGDGRYGLEEINPIGRLALHAFKLCFRHPVTGELMQFETPYPGEFKKLFLKNKEIKRVTKAAYQSIEGDVNSKARLLSDDF